MTSPMTTTMILPRHTFSVSRAFSLPRPTRRAPRTSATQHPTSKNAPSSVLFDQNCSSPTSKFVDPNSLLANGSSVDPKSELLIQLLNRVDYDLLAHLHAQINGHIFRRRGTYTQRSEYNDDHAPFTPEYEWFVEPPPASTEKERTELQNTKHF